MLWSVGGMVLTGEWCSDVLGGKQVEVGVASEKNIKWKCPRLNQGPALKDGPLTA